MILTNLYNLIIFVEGLNKMELNSWNALSLALIFGLQMVIGYINLKCLMGEKSFQKTELLLLALGALVEGYIGFFVGYSQIVIIVISLLLARRFIESEFLHIIGVLAYTIIILLVSSYIAGIGILYFSVDIGLLLVSLHMLATVSISFLLTLFVVKLKPIIRERVPFLAEFNSLFYFMGITILGIYFINIFIGGYLSQHLKNNVDIVILNLVFFILFFVVFVSAFFLYVGSIKNKYEARQKELEYLSNQQYMKVMENQFKEVSKFRHDYKNILTSMENFIVEGDMEGLNNYYYSILKTSSQIIERNDYRLGKLGNIQVRELKSILVSKLIIAQEKGIESYIEVTEMIEKVNMDSVALVRMLGIFLDNAIEELEYLGGGILTVALYQDEKSVHVIIQNSCRKDLPKLHMLKTAGFSTKGKNRGTGLSNVQEIVAKAENLYLSTSIIEHLFTQKLVIEF